MTLRKVDTLPVILLEPGLAFGAGDHPTTQLSLQGLNWALSQMHRFADSQGLRVLDVGTGTGVLAIAAILMGAHKAVAIDLDPAACYEASRNASRNRVRSELAIVAGSLEAVGNIPFDVIVANLRPPTIVSLLPRMATLRSVKGYWVFSGFRPDEARRIEQSFPENMRPLHRLQNRGWSALVAGQYIEL